MPIKHAFTSNKPDSADSTLVKASDWNAEHITDDLWADEETPSGSITSTTGDDGNGTFTLANTPSPLSSLILVRNGVVQLRGSDFTISGNTITFTPGKHPVVGDWIRAWYRY